VLGSSTAGAASSAIPTPGSARRARPEPAEALAILGEIDRLGVRAQKLAASIARASFSGVWLPNWITTLRFLRRDGEHRLTSSGSK
jgi:hypothetical protein